MRKYGVMAAFAGLVLSGSLAKADFVITSQRVALDSTHDKVTFFVQNTNTGDTANTTGTLYSADLSLYAPQTLNGLTGIVPNNGLFVQVSPGSAPFGGNITMGSTTGAGFSQINVTGFNPVSTSAMKLDGTVFSNVGSGGNFAGVTQVAGIGGSVSGNGAYIDAGSAPVQFGVAVVPMGVTVVALQPVAGPGSLSAGHPDGNRTAPLPTTFEPGSETFTAAVLNPNFTVNSTFITTANNARLLAFVSPGAATAVPEPASLGVVGIGLMGILARRRRTA